MCMYKLCMQNHLPGYVQGVWGVSQKEEEEEEAMRTQFVEENVSSLNSQFVILYDLFKVGVGNPCNY